MPETQQENIIVPRARFDVEITFVDSLGRRITGLLGNSPSFLFIYLFERIGIK